MEAQRPTDAPPDILIVEDNAADVELARKAIQKYSPVLKIARASDGEEALEFLCGFGRYAGQSGLAPKLVLLDLKMPRVSGFEVLKQIRANERTRFTPVVVFTSSGEKVDKVKCYEGGANSFIIKPINFEKFSEVIRLICSYWLEYSSLE